LECAILAYHEPWERKSFEVRAEQARANCLRPNDWGHAQNVLLAAVSQHRLSEAARHRAWTWRRKFGDPADEQPTDTLITGGWVTSPIRRDKIATVSDREWLRLITVEHPPLRGTRWKQIGPDLVGEASHRHFAEDFGAVARQNPKRFAALALRIPRTANPLYFSVLLNELASVAPPQNDAAWQPASIAELEAIIEHVGPSESDEYVKALCRLTRERDDCRWSDRVITLIASCSKHPDPRPGEYAAHRLTAGGTSATGIAMTGINCVRGAVAGALAGLLWNRADRLAALLPTVEQLLLDPHPSVRYEALSACSPIWTHDRELAVRLAATGCQHPNDSVLQSPWLSRLFSFARGQYASTLLPIMERMARSRIEKVAERGAAWITACWLDGENVNELVELCETGTKAQRVGVVDAVSEYYATGLSMEKAGPIVQRFFDDRERDVRCRAARVFRWGKALEHKQMPELAMGFVRTRSYLDDPSELFYPLSEYTGHLSRYAQTILCAGEMLASSWLVELRHLQHRHAFRGDKLSVLLLRLYQHAYDSKDTALQSRCLDCWDTLLRNRVGMTETHLRLLDD